jgi:hypothetical protein
MDEDRGVPADALQPEGNTALQSPKRLREDDGELDAQDQHGNKKKNKYRQRTFQHGSRKHRGDKRNDLGRGEYLYVYELHSFYAALTKKVVQTQTDAKKPPKTKPNDRS